MKKVVCVLVAMGVLASSAVVSAAPEVKWNFDGRIRFFNDDNNLTGRTDKNTFDNRFRVKASKELDKNWVLTARLKTGDNVSSNAQKTNANTYLDQLHFTYTGDGYQAIVGRHGAFLGQGGLYDQSGDLDGLTFKVGGPKDQFKFDLVSGLYKNDRNDRVTGAQVQAALDKSISLTGVYLNYKKGNASGGTVSNQKASQTYYAVGTKIALADNINVIGEYAKNNDVAANKGANAYYVRVYKGATWKFDDLPTSKKGSDVVMLTYWNIGSDSIPKDLTTLGANANIKISDANNKKGFVFSYANNIFNNTTAYVEYYSLKLVDTPNTSYKMTTAGLHFKF